MASELSQLIESELRKAESANKPDEHQRRLASLRVKTGLDKPPPGPLQRLCTPKRQVIAAAVVTVLVLLLIVVVAVHRRHTLGQGNAALRTSTDEYEPLLHSTRMPGTTPAETSSSGLVGGFEMVTASASDDGTLADDGQAPLTQQQLAQAPAHIGHLAPQLQPTTAPTGANDTVLPTAVAPSQH